MACDGHGAVVVHPETSRRLNARTLAALEARLIEAGG
jgi:hypothetical protein